MSARKLSIKTKSQKYRVTKVDKNKKVVTLDRLPETPRDNYWKVKV